MKNNWFLLFVLCSIVIAQERITIVEQPNPEHWAVLLAYEGQIEIPEGADVTLPPDWLDTFKGTLEFHKATLNLPTGEVFVGSGHCEKGKCEYIGTMSIGETRLEGIIFSEDGVWVVDTPVTVRDGENSYTISGLRIDSIVSGTLSARSDGISSIDGLEMEFSGQIAYTSGNLVLTGEDPAIIKRLPAHDLQIQNVGSGVVFEDKNLYIGKGDFLNPQPVLVKDGFVFANNDELGLEFGLMETRNGQRMYHEATLRANTPIALLTSARELQTYIDSAHPQSYFYETIDQDNAKSDIRIQSSKSNWIDVTLGQGHYGIILDNDFKGDVSDDRKHVRLRANGGDGFRLTDSTVQHIAEGGKATLENGRFTFHFDDEIRFIPPQGKLTDEELEYTIKYKQSVPLAIKSTLSEGEWFIDGGGVWKNDVLLSKYGDYKVLSEAYQRIAQQFDTGMTSIDVDEEQQAKLMTRLTDLQANGYFDSLDRGILHQTTSEAQSAFETAMRDGNLGESVKAARRIVQSYIDGGDFIAAANEMERINEALGRNIFDPQPWWELVATTLPNDKDGDGKHILLAWKKSLEHANGADRERIQANIDTQFAIDLATSRAKIQNAQSYSLSRHYDDILSEAAAYGNQETVLSQLYDEAEGYHQRRALAEVSAAYGSPNGVTTEALDKEYLATLAGQLGSGRIESIERPKMIDNNGRITALPFGQGSPDDPDILLLSEISHTISKMRMEEGFTHSSLKLERVGPPPGVERYTQLLVDNFDRLAHAGKWSIIETTARNGDPQTRARYNDLVSQHMARAARGEMTSILFSHLESDVLSDENRRVMESTIIAVKTRDAQQYLANNPISTWHETPFEGVYDQSQVSQFLAQQAGVSNEEFLRQHGFDFQQASNTRIQEMRDNYQNNDGCGEFCAQDIYENMKGVNDLADRGFGTTRFSQEEYLPYGRDAMVDLLITPSRSLQAYRELGEELGVNPDQTLLDDSLTVLQYVQAFDSSATAYLMSVAYLVGEEIGAPSDEQSMRQLMAKIAFDQLSPRKAQSIWDHTAIAMAERAGDQEYVHEGLKRLQEGFKSDSTKQTQHSLSIPWSKPVERILNIQTQVQTSGWIIPFLQTQRDLRAQKALATDTLIPAPRNIPRPSGDITVIMRGY